MGLASYNELRKLDISKHCETRKDEKGNEFQYLNWAKCIDLLHENGAEKVYFEPITNENGSSLFMTDIEFIDKNGNKNRCYEIAVKVVVDENEWVFRSALMNGSNPVKDNSMSQQRIWNAQTRLFVKCVAIHTGLGFDLWLKEEQEEIKLDKSDDLSIHNIFSIKERCQILYTNKLKEGLTTKEIAEKLHKTEDEVKALFSYFDTLSNFEKDLANIDTKSR